MRARKTHEVSEEAVLYQYLDSLLTEPDTERGEDIISDNTAGHSQTQTHQSVTHAPVSPDKAAQGEVSGAVSLDKVDTIFSMDDNRAAIFQINETKIGIPSRYVSAIIDIDDKLDIRRNREKNSYGSLTYHDHTYRLLDVQAMLENNDETRLTSDYRTIILLEPGHWGIACHNFDSIRPLNIQNIRWRRERRTRACLAGVDIAEMCLIFDIISAINSIKTTT